MNRTPKATALFLHGGPGLNAAVERAWFAGQKTVQWWDQPRVRVDTPAAFEATLAAAAERLSYMHDEAEAPIDLIGWSFGTRLAVELACRAPSQVRGLTLLAPTLVLQEAIMRLAERLLALGAGDWNLDQALRRAQDRGDCDALLDLATALFSVPRLLDRYWAPGNTAECERHAQLAATANWFDATTFAAVARDLHDRPLPARQPTGYPMSILAGRHDPYFAGDHDVDAWRRQFPGAEIRIVEAGHMVHFERPVDEWLRDCASPCRLDGIPLAGAPTRE